MGKSRGVEAKLSRLRALRAEGQTSTATSELRQALGDHSNLVVADAAALIGEWKMTDLASDLVAAFERLMVEPEEIDKLCRGKLAIVQALDRIEHEEPAIFLRGIRHRQFEPVWGGSEDTAATLRGLCAFALVRLQYRGVLLLLADLLADDVKAARAAAAQAIGATGVVAAIPLLRYKARAGDEDPAVIGECFTALLSLDPAESIPFVAEFLEDTDDSIAEAAALALGESRRPAALPPLTSLCERTVSGTLQDAAYLAVGMLRLPAATENLVNAVAEGPTSRALAALAALMIHRHQPGMQERIAAAVARNNDRAIKAYFDKRFPSDS